MADSDTIKARQRATLALHDIADDLRAIRTDIRQIEHAAGGGMATLCQMIDSATHEAEQQARSCARAAKFIAGEAVDDDE